VILLLAYFPYILLTVAIRNREERVEALLDTGFDGDIVIPPHLLTNGTPPESYLRWTLADGSTVMAPAYQLPTADYLS
jgi:predicted aspartyl protease